MAESGWRTAGVSITTGLGGAIATTLFQAHIGGPMMPVWPIVWWGTLFGLLLGFLAFSSVYMAKREAWKRQVRSAVCAELGPPQMWVQQAYIKVKATEPHAIGATVDLGISAPIEADSRDFTVGFLPCGISGVKGFYTSDAAFDGSVALSGTQLTILPGTRGLTREFDAIGEAVRKGQQVEVAVIWKDGTPMHNALRFQGVSS